MNYPLPTILITKIYMIYNLNFIYTWQLLDQVHDRFTWPGHTPIFFDKDLGFRVHCTSYRPRVCRLLCNTEL